MQTNNHDRKGELRCLTPEEIGKFVANRRKRLGWKQLTLAFEAKIHERTVQRIERGEKVDDDSLRKVAKALSVKEDAFLGPRYIPTEDEAIAEAVKAVSEITVTEAHDFTTVKDSDAVLRAHGWIVDDHAIPDLLADQVALFKDLVRDWGDIFDDLPSESARVDACRSVLAEAKRIEDAGCRARYGVYMTDDEFTVAVFVFAAKDDEGLCNVTQLIVPRSFTKMAAESIRT